VRPPHSYSYSIVIHSEEFQTSPFRIGKKYQAYSRRLRYIRCLQSFPTVLCPHLFLLWPFGSFSGHALPNFLPPQPRLQLRFRNKSKYYRVGLLTPLPNPQPGGTGYPLLSGASPLTCPAWEPLPVAVLTPS
jgi:hypothetical protein